MDPLYNKAKIPVQKSLPLSFFVFEEEELAPRQEPSRNTKRQRKINVVQNIYANDPIPGYATLARIDNVYQLFSCVREPLFCLSLNNGPGAYDAYLHFKLNYNCQIAAMSFAPYELSQIKGFALNARTFYIDQGPAATGDLRKEYAGFLEHIQQVEEGVHFAFCSLPEVEQRERTQFFLANVYVAFTLLLEDNHAVFELPGQGGPLENDLLRACAMSFTRISVFKPVNDLSKEYLICERYKKDKLLLIRLSVFMSRVLSLQKDSFFFEDSVPRLDAWLNKIRQDMERDLQSWQPDAAYNQTLLWAGCQLIR